MQLQVNDIIFHNWKIKKVIGEGSFGTVYEIEREEYGNSNRIYKAAAKVISIPSERNSFIGSMQVGMSADNITEYYKSVVEDIISECAMMERMKGDSHIVSYEDHMVVQGEDKNHFMIMIRMELLTPFLAYSTNHTLTEYDVVQLGIDICRGLETCQKLNIIHRDIKPENIFLSDTGNYKLGDFGISRVLDESEMAVSKKGTQLYMAPEVYRGDEYNVTADIYSLGLVLYILMNKRRAPFLPPAPQPIKYKDTENALKKRLLGEPLPKPETAGADFSEVILKACSHLPQHRYQSAKEFRRCLEDVLDKIEKNVIVNQTVGVTEEPQPVPLKQSGTLSIFGGPQRMSLNPEEIKRQEEEKRQREEARRLAEEKRLAEARLQEAKRLEEERRLAEQKRKEEERIAEQRRLAEERKLEEEKRIAEAQRLEEERKQEKARRIAEEIKKAREKKIAEEQKQEEAKRLAEKKRIAEQRKKEDEKTIQLQNPTLGMTEEEIQREKEKKQKEAEEIRRREEEKKKRETEEMLLRAEEKRKQLEEEEKKRQAALEEEKKREQERKAALKKRLLFFCRLSVVVVGFLIVTVIVKGATDKKKVPSLSGMTLEQAQETLKKKKLALGTTEYSFSHDVEKDRIVSQQVEEGTKVERGSCVDVVISKGEQLTQMPDFYSMTEEQANQLLAQIPGDALGAAANQYHSQIAAGCIFAQSPAANEPVNDIAEISLFYSSGPAAMPGLEGMTQEEAVAKLAEYGITPQLTEENSAQVKKDYIISQSVPLDTPIGVDSQIVLVVSKGASEIVVPDVAGLTKADAIKKLTAAGYQKKAVKSKKAYSDSVAKGKVISQSQKKGSKVKKGSEITLTISDGSKPAVPKSNSNPAPSKNNSKKNQNDDISDSWNWSILDD